MTMRRPDGATKPRMATIRIEPELWNQARAKATAAGFSFSELARRLFTRYLRDDKLAIEIHSTTDSADEVAWKLKPKETHS